MKPDDTRIQMLLRSDAEELGRRAALPAASAIVGKAKIRVARKRCQWVTGLISLIEILGAAAAAFAMLGAVWATLLNAPVSSHLITVAVAGMLTLTTIGACAAIPLVNVSALNSTSPLKRP